MIQNRKHCKSFSRKHLPTKTSSLTRQDLVEASHQRCTYQWNQDQDPTHSEDSPLALFRRVRSQSPKKYCWGFPRSISISDLLCIDPFGKRTHPYYWFLFATFTSKYYNLWKVLPSYWCQCQPLQSSLLHYCMKCLPFGPTFYLCLYSIRNIFLTQKCNLRI